MASCGRSHNGGYESLKRPDTPEPGSTATATREEKLRYVRSMLRVLRDISATENTDVLTYLIEMAHMEASDVLGGGRSSARLRKRPNRMHQHHG